MGNPVSKFTEGRSIAKAPCPTYSGERRNTISEEASMNQVQVEQKSYQMPPQDGFTVAYFLTVADIERSARFYETVFGGRILSSRLQISPNCAPEPAYR